MIAPDDLDRLRACLDGELPPQEAAALDQRLKNEPPLADALLRLARDEAILAEWARVAAKTDAIETIAANRRSAVIRFPSRRWWPAAVAALLLVALGVAYWSRPTASPQRPPLAQLQNVTGDVRRFPGNERLVGASEFNVYSGQGVKVVGEESYAVVVYADGTRLELDGDATIAELSGGETTGKRVVLTEGNLRADVAKQPPGAPMTLVTPSAEVTVLGTKFGLSSGAEATYVETQEGAVRLTRTGDGRSVEVPAGFEALAEAAAAVFAALPSPPRVQRSRFATPGFYRTTALSPDGRTLVTSQFGAGEVVLWDAATETKRLALDVDPAQVVATAFSADGRRFAAAGAEGSIKLWDAAAGEPVQTIVGPSQLQSLALSDDGETVVALSGPPQQEKTLTSWNATTGERRIDPQTFSGEAWVLSADARWLAVGTTRRSEVIVWDVFAGRRRAVLQPFPGRILCLAFSPDGSQLAVSDMTGRVTVWNVADERLLSTIRPAGQTVQGLAYSPDGSLLAMGQRRATVRLWDVAAAKQVAILEGPVNPGSTATVRPMYFSPDGRTLATTESHDAGTVRLWDLPLK